MGTKYIFVTGGVVSSLGKGITAASLGRLLKSRGYKVAMQKFDPYINVDPGTMSPYQHGEVFVTDDGAETDLDLGHYERFVDENLNIYSNVTTGKVYQYVLDKEREGAYLGSTVQVIPHITDEIKRRIKILGNEADIVITEIGGTVGDIESLPFLEAIRQMKYDEGEDNIMYIHVTLIPFLHKAGELKTKPTQHSVKELRGIGIQPNVIICRSPMPLSNELKDKINKNVKVAIVGKYVELKDAYISVYESLEHAGMHLGAKIDIQWISSEELNKDNVDNMLGDSDAIVIPGGFGDRGIEGKILASKYAREKKVPMLGLCLGMQIASIEFARNVVGLENANSQEFNQFSEHKIIHIMEDQKYIEEMGGTMRLGSYECNVVKGTKTHELYKITKISERHRHRYEFNNEYREKFIEHGFVISGVSPDNKLVEIIELKDHPFYIACQFHPEFKSRPNRPHPLFYGLVKAAIK